MEKCRVYTFRIIYIQNLCLFKGFITKLDLTIYGKKVQIMIDNVYYVRLPILYTCQQ